MQNNDSVLQINCTFLKNRIAELGLRQWWLAEQVCVDRKTVSRWIQGRVRSIQKENVEALAKVLACSVDDLTLFNEADQLATAEDQKKAANLLSSSSILERLGPIGEWDVIESLLKAAVVPNLPLGVLVDLYNKLAVANWRQSKIDQAAAFNEKAEEISRKIGDKGALAAALLSKANILSWRGKTTQAIETYGQCIGLRNYIDQKTLGSIYSNRGAVLYEAGDLINGKAFQLKSIEVFSFHGQPMNLSISWCHLAMIELQLSDLSAACVAIQHSENFAKQDEYRRGVQMCKLIQAEIFAREGSFAIAKKEMFEALEGFSALEIEEGLNYEIAGRVCRFVGDYGESVAYLKRGIDVSDSFPMALAALFFELGTTLLTEGSKVQEGRAAMARAEALFLECEAPMRAKAAKNAVRALS